MTIRNQDRKALNHLLKNASRYGDDFEDIAHREFTAAKLRAVAKRYDGKVFRVTNGKRYRVDYLAPQAAGWTCGAGIINPGHGISSAIKAQVAVTPLR